MKCHKEIMTALRDEHRPLVSLIGKAPIHYLDIPFYGNIGDILIMSGTLQFFEREQMQVTQMGMYFNYDPVWTKPENVIVFQGGGNFGDIYGPFQHFREHVISALPANRIIILPQTIYFEKEETYIRCCDLYSQHPDLHICVRDQRSFALARKMTQNVYLMPDMAHQLWPVVKSCPETNMTLRLFRRDGEAAIPLVNQDDTLDWSCLIGKSLQFFLSQVAERTMTHAHRLTRNNQLTNLEARLWIKQAKSFASRAIDLFSRYEFVETDRLHAHILACLMGIPNLLFDNSYGKNHGYFKEWIMGSEIVSLSGKDTKLSVDIEKGISDNNG